MAIKNNLSELGRNNRTAMVAHTTSTIVFAIFNLAMIMGGQRAAALIILDLLLGLGPVAVERYFWIKDTDTPMIRHLVAIGFAVFYTFEMFSSNTYIIYVLAIPIIFVVTVYHDPKLVMQINIGSFIIQIIMAAIGLSTGRYGYSNPNDAVCQIIAMGMVAAFSHWAALTTLENTKKQIEVAMQAKNASDELVVNMTEMSEKMTTGITKIGEGLTKVKDAADTTLEAMDQLSSGASQTTEAVMEQTAQTEQIQQMVNNVSQISQNITDKMAETMKVVAKGRDDIATLVDQVNQSVVDGDNVAQKLENLDKYVNEMHSIVKIISGIANQTSMLALNASIEAARAGEAGRGFAVVASQVTNMAGQTKDATVKISDLIEAVSYAIEEVISVIRQMLDGINLEKESSAATVDSFRGIRSNIKEVNEDMASLTQSIDELNTANKTIVESATTISAISQEVLANTNETTLAQQKNVKVIENISNEMNELLDFIHEGK